mgnify:CR=1 FL=1
MKKTFVPVVAVAASALVVGAPAWAQAASVDNGVDISQAANDDHTYTGDDPYIVGGWDDPAEETSEPSVREEPAQIDPKLKAKSIKRHSKLRIKVRPKWKSGDYTLQLQRKRGSVWVEVDSVETQGRSESVTVSPERGKYRVYLPPGQNDLGDATSKTVRVAG